MPDIASDFLNLLPGSQDDYDGPLYYLWVYDPQEAVVHLEENESKHPADHISHPALSHQKGITHESKEEGYVYHIEGGWRITNADHRPVEDPFVLNEILKALNGLER